MTDTKLKIIFMGTPDFASEALQAICEASSHEVICVYSQPPRPKGRGHKVQNSPVHAYANSRNIEVRTPKSLKSEAEQKAFTALNADIAVVAAYGLLLPKAILEAPKHGCINIHASLLPRWRGASPIQQAILAGDDESGVTLMQMDAGLDTGDMLMKQSVPITPETTASTLHDQLAKLGGEMVIDALSDLDALKHEEQNEALTTYAPLLKKQDGIIDWNKPAREIDRQIRALNPWPSVCSSLKNAQFKFLQATLTPDKTDKPAGTLLDHTGNIACGEGSVLRLTQIHPAGKKPMDIISAINGGYIKVGDVLS